MPWWHRAHVALVVKKSAGMIPLTFVSADDGKNGLFGPRPSSFMLAGTLVGLRTTYALRHFVDAPTRGATMARRIAAAHPMATSARSRRPPLRSPAMAANARS